MPIRGTRQQKVANLAAALCARWVFEKEMLTWITPIYTPNMKKTPLLYCQLVAVLFFVTSTQTVFGQWEPTGKLERKEKAVDPRADADIVVAKPTRITADNTGTVAITFQKEIWKNAGAGWFRLEVPRFPFSAIDEFEFQDVAAFEGVTYLVAGSGKIYKVDEKNGWVEVAGDERARRIATDNHGQLWIIDKNYAVKYFDAGNGTWTVYPGNAKANDIAAFNGTPVIVAQPGGNIMYGTGARWERLGNLDWNCNNIGIDPTNGMVWMITGTKSKVWAYTATGWLEYPGGGIAADVCGYNATPYTLTPTSQVMKGRSTDAAFANAGAIGNTPTATPAPTAVAEVTAAAVAVVPSATDPYLRTAKDTYKTNEYFEVEFGNFEGSLFDSIVLVEKGKPDDEMGTFKYTGGGANGKISLSYAWTGTYELRGFFNNGKEVKARLTIKID